MGLSILVIEPDRQQRLVIMKTLADDGYLPQSCDDYATARLMAKTSIFDVVIADVVCDARGAEQFVAWMRGAEGGMPTTPVFMLVSQQDTVQRLFAVSAGASEVVEKPIYDRELVNRLNLVLDKLLTKPAAEQAMRRRQTSRVSIPPAAQDARERSDTKSLAAAAPTVMLKAVELPAERSYRLTAVLLAILAGLGLSIGGLALWRHQHPQPPANNMAALDGLGKKHHVLPTLVEPERPTASEEGPPPLASLPKSPRPSSKSRNLPGLLDTDPTSVLAGLEDLRPVTSEDRRLTDLLKKGKALLLDQRYDDANAIFKQAAEAFPSSPLPPYWTGETLLAQGKPLAAFKQFQRAVTIRSDFADVWRRVGYIYEFKGQEEDARRAYRRYLELSPKGAGAELVRAILVELETVNP